MDAKTIPSFGLSLRLIRLLDPATFDISSIDTFSVSLMHCITF